MKKLTVSVVLLISMVLLMNGCGTEEVDWDDFFNEYYKECIQLCKACSELADMCGIVDYSIMDCVLDRWDEGSSNDRCTDHIAQIMNEWESSFGNCMAEHIPLRCSF